ncbi:Zn(2)-C6 fungal-type domain-containing protein [Mycena sanguinolenta]|uniref:Zn(2)-C6 fungal-type domain-containing protein n=1 Tax=Mycena sanguinolenta TaxID=230812 RepID=A0A8H6YGI5_9AGAR|nr:Zn(2)-C6 fungal-type domain-containing protein [Mycena sanguinolenta]
MNENHAKLYQVLRRSYRVPPPAPIAQEVITGEPILPPELEREIFELAAAIPNYWTNQHVGDMALILPQVCRRAQSWIEPLIYERIALSKPTMDNYNFERRLQLFLQTINTRPANFFAANVKYLYFGPSVQLPIIQHVLSVCTGVVSVGCHHPYDSIADSLAPLPLQRLLLSQLMLPIELPPWTASLTHLGLSDTVPNNHPQIFRTFPALTHFAVDFETVKLDSLIRTIQSLLIAGPHLQCLVLTANRADSRRISQRLFQEKFRDTRFSLFGLMSIESGWYRGRRVGDLFEEAEAHLKV